MISHVSLTFILITATVIETRFNAESRVRRDVASACGQGYRPGTFYGCTDIDECSENATICANATCVNIYGSYKCEELVTTTALTTTEEQETSACGQGYRPGTFYGCTDIDECSENATICENATCVNTDGSYRCEEIETTTATEELKFCNEGYVYVNYWSGCQDINECNENVTICGNLTCLNIEGSYKCVEQNSTPETDEITTITTTLPEATTTQDPTSIRIESVTDTEETHEKLSGYCDDGYTKGSWGKCVDIDECIEGIHNCSQNERCDNKEGSFDCICSDENLKDTSGRCSVLNKCGKGFVENGDTCDDIDECENNPCSHECSNTEGSFECSCPSGYELHSDQMTCIDINECELSISACEQQCVNNEGSFHCDCREGFKIINGTRCVNSDNECVGLDCKTDGSELNRKNEKQRFGEIEEEKEVNHVIFGSPTDSRNLRCPIGYFFNKETSACEDIDECKTLLHNCEVNSECRNSVGSFSCIQCESRSIRMPNGSCEIPRCYPGYEFNEDKKECVDFDECSHINPCDGLPCWNVEGAYFCGCQNGNCDRSKYRKGCIPGFTPSTYSIKHCEDIDECSSTLLNSCESDQDCVNTFGGYYCRCKLGLRKDRYGRCTDIDECSLFPSICLGSCINTYGSYSCTGLDNRQREEKKCEGYRDNVTGECIVITTEGSKCEGSDCSTEENCDRGFRQSSAGVCEDIDECREEVDICGSDGSCENTHGGYRCININGVTENVCQSEDCNREHGCQQGYRMNSFGTCEDMDECQVEDICEDDERCENTPGSYTCIEILATEFENCPQGYFYDKLSERCEDINECQMEIDRCMEFECENTIGSYKCKERKCFPGFEIVNGACQDIDECRRLGNAACMANETCINSKGLYFCQKCKAEQDQYRCYSRRQCLPGFEPQQYSCVDVDECKLGFHNCSAEEHCVNTIPGYRCECREGYTRNRNNKCERNHANCGTDNICADLTQDFPCPLGYELSSDLLKCDDINECLHNRCKPEEKCENFRGGYRCYIN